VVKFQVHPTANVLEFEHGASPRGASDGHMDWVRTEFWMAGEKSVAASKENGSVAVVHGLDVENGGGWKVAEKDSAFDLGLDDGVVHVVSEIGVRSEHGAAWIRVMGFGWRGKGCLRICGNVGSGASEEVLQLLFAPPGLDYISNPLPTAYAVGCFPSSLRGLLVLVGGGGLGWSVGADGVA